MSTPTQRRGAETKEGLDMRLTLAPAPQLSAPDR